MEYVYWIDVMKASGSELQSTINQRERDEARNENVSEIVGNYRHYDKK